MSFLFLGVFLSWLCLRIYKCHRLKIIPSEQFGLDRIYSEENHNVSISIISNFELRYLRCEKFVIAPMMQCSKYFRI